MTAAIVLLGLLLDKLIGEPKRWHPLVGFGNAANYVEHKLHKATKPAGTLAVILLLVPLVMLSAWLQTLSPVIVGIFTVYLVVGWKSLAQHATAVQQMLYSNDLPTARTRVGYMVSRETQALDEQAVTRATLESVLENGSDAIFAPIFWFAVAGVPGAVLYRLVNTLDAMWGYKNDRYQQFGWAAARLDDALNYLPARLAALSYALVGNTRSALMCWRTQAAACESPNAGPVMAAGAGSLQLELGGDAVYGGQRVSRPTLGQGRVPGVGDISAALSLINRSILLWWVAIVIIGVTF